MLLRSKGLQGNLQISSMFASYNRARVRVLRDPRVWEVRFLLRQDTKDFDHVRADTGLQEPVRKANGGATVRGRYKSLSLWTISIRTEYTEFHEHICMFSVLLL